MTVDAVRARFGWTDWRQVVLHAGNIGLKQGLEQVVDAARRAADAATRSGSSSPAAEVRQDAIRAAARWPPERRVPRATTGSDVHASLLAAADVLLLSERASQVDMSLPSKLTAYYAAGRPIVAAVGVDGGSAAEVERSGAGIVVPRRDEPVALLDALAQLAR